VTWPDHTYTYNNLTIFEYEVHPIYRTKKMIEKSQQVTNYFWRVFSHERPLCGGSGGAVHGGGGGAAASTK
jgi:hypothetical protein